LSISTLILGSFIIIESKKAKAYTSFYTDCKPITYFNQEDRNLRQTDPNLFKTLMEENAEKLKSENIETCGELHKRNFDSPPTCICKTLLEVETDVDDNVFLYYKLDNFYQNHRRMMASRDEIQLLAQTESDIQNPQKTCYINGAPSDVAEFPCGAVANSFFNDTFFIYNDDFDNVYDKVTDPATDAWKMSGKDIAWMTDKVQKFDSNSIVKDKAKNNEIIENVKKPKNWQINVTDLGTERDLYYRQASGTSGLGLKNEDFIVWMRVAGLVDFRKFYRIVTQQVTKGTKTVLIFNNFNVDKFNGKKAIVLATANWVGGDNTFLGGVYCATGCFSFIMAIIVSIFGCKSKTD